MRYFVPHRVQNIVMKDFLSKLGLTYVLPKTEIQIPQTFPVLRDILKDKSVKEVFFYSLEMMPFESNEMIEKVYERVRSGVRIWFCVENILLEQKNLDSFIEDQLIMRKKRKGVLIED